MKCKLCQQLENDSSSRVLLGAERKCAFKQGEFYTENWMCGTMNELREIIEAGDLEVYSSEENAAILVVPDSEESTHLFLAWYKHRGRTTMAQEWTVDDVLKPLTLKTAEAVIEFYKERER